MNKFVFISILFRITADDVKPHTEQLLNNLFGAFSHEGSSENEYVMKGLYQLF